MMNMKATMKFLKKKWFNLNHAECITTHAVID